MGGRVGDLRPRKVGIPRYDLRDPYYTAVTLPWGWFLLAVLGLVAGVNLLFAALYLLQPGAVQNLPPGSYASAFFFSVETLSTVGYGGMAPATLYGHLVATVEIVTGIGFTASLTGILFVRLSRPRARILFAEHPTLNDEDGVPVMAIRIANGRQMLLTNATVAISVMVLEPDDDGRSVWRIRRLAIEEEQASLFPLTWTLRHRVEPDGPLAGLGGDVGAARPVKIFVFVFAHDPAISADVHIVHEYAGEDVKVGRRYAEAIAHDGDGRILADLSRIGALE